MLVLIRLVWKICTLKRGPQDIPYSVFLFTILLLMDFVVGLVVYVIPDAEGMLHPLGKVIVYLLANNLSFLGTVYVILLFHNHVARALQTISAMLGVDIILNILHLPFLLTAGMASAHPGLASLFVLGTMAIFIWEMVVYSHIFSQALAIPVFRAGGYALLLFVIYLLTNYLMFPGPH